MEAGKVVIAFDPGYRLGYAVGQKPNKLIEAGTFYAQRDKDKEVSFFVKQLLQKHKPQLVLIEDYRIYNPFYRGKHKTSEVIGIIKSLCFSEGVEVEMLQHNRWKAEFVRVYSAIQEKLGDDWKKALGAKSEHTRDAVSMLLPYVFSIYDLVRR